MEKQSHELLPPARQTASGSDQGIRISKTERPSSRNWSGGNARPESAATARITRFSTAVHRNDRRTGLVLPGRFIPILQEIGLIHDVGRWAPHTAIDDYLRWNSAGIANLRVAVNVSPVLLRNRGFIDDIRRAVDIDPRAAPGLELEITESLIMEDVKRGVKSCKRFVSWASESPSMTLARASLAQLLGETTCGHSENRSLICDGSGGWAGRVLAAA